MLTSIFLSFNACISGNGTFLNIHKLGPPVIKELPKQLHAVLGEQFQITCIATNDQDAPMNLMFSWHIPNRVQPNITTTDEDNSHMATSTHHISTVTRDHSGMYMCTVSNGNDQGNANSVNWTVVVEGKYFKFIIFNILYYDILQSDHRLLQISALLT